MEIYPEWPYTSYDQLSSIYLNACCADKEEAFKVSLTLSSTTQSKQHAKDIWDNLEMLIMDQDSDCYILLVVAKSSFTHHQPEGLLQLRDLCYGSMMVTFLLELVQGRRIQECPDLMINSDTDYNTHVSRQSTSIAYDIRTWMKDPYAAVSFHGQLSNQEIASEEHLTLMLSLRLMTITIPYHQYLLDTKPNVPTEFVEQQTRYSKVDVTNKALETDRIQLKYDYPPLGIARCLKVENQTVANSKLSGSPLEGRHFLIIEKPPLTRIMESTFAAYKMASSIKSSWLWMSVESSEFQDIERIGSEKSSQQINHVENMTKDIYGHLSASNVFDTYNAPETGSEASSSNSVNIDVTPNNQLPHVQKWTQAHPLENIIGDKDRPVSTRKQLETDAMWCFFNEFLTHVEPKTYKQAFVDTVAGLMALREENYMSIERLDVWILVPCPEILKKFGFDHATIGHSNGGESNLDGKIRKEDRLIDPTRLAKPTEMQLTAIKRIFRY
ncbi:hypothetical protein Tco_0117749 [Tanacetum coccineum]